jgi:hypothetical protein
MSATTPRRDRGRAAAVEALRSGAIVALPTTRSRARCRARTPGGIEWLNTSPPAGGDRAQLDDAAQAALLGTCHRRRGPVGCRPGGLTIVAPSDRRRAPDATGGAATIGCAS